MTPDQMMLMAKARRRRAEAEAGANAPATADTGGNWGTTLKEWGSGAVEGFGGLAAIADKVNPLSRVRNMALDGLDYMGVTSPEVSEKSKAAFSDPNSLVEPYLAEPNPNYAGVRKGGQFFGGQAPIAAATGGLSTLAGVGGTFLTSQLASVGDTVGRNLSEEHFPGNSWTGEAPPSEDPAERTWYDYARSWTPGPADVAGFVGAGAAGSVPALTKGLVKTGAKIKYGAEDMPSKSTDPNAVLPEDMLNAGEAQGVSVTPGMVGNRNMAAIENNIRTWPIGGGSTSKKMAGIPDEMHGALQGAAEKSRTIVDPRSGQTISRGANVENLPSGISTLAADNYGGVKAAVKKPYDVMEKKIGTNTAVDVAPVQKKLANEYNKASVVHKDGLKSSADTFAGDRRFPIDKGLHTQLTADRAQAQAWLDHVSNPTNGFTKADINRAVRDVAKVDKEIDKNIGMRFRDTKVQQKAIRAKAFPKNGTEPSVDQATFGRVDQALTDVQRGAARNAGYSDAQFGKIRNDFRVASSTDPLDPHNTGTLPKLKKVAGKEGRDAETWLSANNLDRPERLGLLERSTEQHAKHLESQGKIAEANDIRARWRQITGDLIEKTGEKKPGEMNVGSTFSPESFKTRWQNQKSPEARSILTGSNPEVEQTIADLVTLGKGIKFRGNMVGSSNTADQANLLKMFGNPKKLIGGALAFPYRKAIDLAVGSEWLPKALVYGGKKGLLEDILKRGGAGAAVSAANSSMADQFGGPR